MFFRQIILLNSLLYRYYGFRAPDSLGSLSFSKCITVSVTSSQFISPGRSVSPALCSWGDHSSAASGRPGSPSTPTASQRRQPRVLRVEHLPGVCSVLLVPPWGHLWLPAHQQCGAAIGAQPGRGSGDGMEPGRALSSLSVGATIQGILCSSPGPQPELGGSGQLPPAAAEAQGFEGLGALCTVSLAVRLINTRSHGMSPTAGEHGKTRACSVAFPWGSPSVGSSTGLSRDSKAAGKLDFSSGWLFPFFLLLS